MKKILFAGCSFTANCGFNESNVINYHWPHLFAKNLDVDYDNIAIGGMSNHEIFLRIVEQLSFNDYDMLVVMWSSLSRKWVYYADSNVDDFSIVNKLLVTGLRRDNPELKEYAKLYLTYFNNDYIELKHWLCEMISLQAMLSQKKIPFIFIKGFENNINSFCKIRYDPTQGFLNLDSKIKHVLDFDNRPDSYIEKKILTIQNLITKINVNNWVNFFSTSFFDMQVDYSDDKKHPGSLTNKMLLENLMIHFNKNFKDMELVPRGGL